MTINIFEIEKKKIEIENGKKYPVYLGMSIKNKKL